MKQSVGAPVIVAAITVLVLLVGFIGYRLLGPSGKTTPKPAGSEPEARYQQQYQNYNQQRPQGGSPMAPGP